MRCCWGSGSHGGNVAPLLPRSGGEGRALCTPSRSRRVFRARSDRKVRPPRSEGAENAGRPMRPIAACAGVVIESTRVSQVTPVSTGIPRAMVLTASFVISPAIGLFCHRRRQRFSCQLDASVEASGPHDFSVRKQTLSSEAPLASTASRPNVRDDGQRPSFDRTGQASI